MLSGFVSWLLSKDNYHWTCFECSVYTCMVISHVFKLKILLGICNSVNCFFIQKYGELISNFATFQSTNLYVVHLYMLFRDINYISKNIYLTYVRINFLSIISVLPLLEAFLWPSLVSSTVTDKN